MPKLHGHAYGRRELMRHFGHSSQAFGIRLATLADGGERGVRVLELRAGNGLAFSILVDRCMDIGSLEIAGAGIGFHSPTGFRSPWLHESADDNGFGFLRSFSGLLNTCGLDHVMGPESADAGHYNYPYRTRIDHGQHGRVSFLPARLAGYGERWEGDRCFLWAAGEIVQAAMYAENLVLHRRIEIEVGTWSIRITDRVENRGFHPTPHMMLYHVNLGWPLLDEGAEMLAPIVSTPWTAHDPAAPIGPRHQPGPQTRFVEQVYEHVLAPDAEGRVRAALVNRRFGNSGIGFMLTWRAGQLPAFFQWQNLQEGNYVMGLEPATIHAGTRADRLARGEVIWLNHGEGRDYDLTFDLLPDAAAIDAAAAVIGTFKS